MLIVSAEALRLAARVLDRPVAHRVIGKTLLDLTERPLPLPFADVMANTRGRVVPPVGSPLVAWAHTHETAPHDAPLTGDTVVVKDSLDVAGHATSLGLSSTIDDDLATEDAVLVQRLRAVGAIIAKGKMTELGMDGLGLLLAGDAPINPVSPRHVVGGSSTGTAAAVASGRARYGVGGDGLGSVRIPAAFTGLVGLKPGTGALPSTGYRSVAPMLDVPGPMARTAADCTRLYQVLAGLPLTEPTPWIPETVGLVDGLGPELASRDVRRAFDRMLDALGVRRVPVSVEGASSHPALALAVSTRALARSAYAARIDSGQGLMNLVFGRAFGVHDERVDEKLEALRAAAVAAFDRVPVLAMPTTAVPAPALRAGLLRGGQDALLLRAIGAYTPLANLTGLPAIAVPAGRDPVGRPLSIMFVGPPGSEERLLSIAAAVEATRLGNAPLDPS
ncbi:MAG: amidase [Sandaracinus sp.]|nr:amidase [Sandaracinus sp.]